MTYRALMTQLSVLMVAAFFLLGNASLSTSHKPFHPKPLPNQAASAVLSVFRYDTKGISKARCIADPEDDSCNPSLQKAMAQYDR